MTAVRSCHLLPNVSVDHREAMRRLPGAGDWANGPLPDSTAARPGCPECGVAVAGPALRIKAASTTCGGHGEEATPVSRDGRQSR